MGGSRRAGGDGEAAGVVRRTSSLGRVTEDRGTGGLERPETLKRWRDKRCGGGNTVMSSLGGGRSASSLPRPAPSPPPSGPPLLRPAPAPPRSCAARPVRRPVTRKEHVT